MASQHTAEYMHLFAEFGLLSRAVSRASEFELQVERHSFGLSGISRINVLVLISNVAVLRRDRTVSLLQNDRKTAQRRESPLDMKSLAVAMRNATTQK